MADFDFVVVGAGHNALLTAAYLARAGQRVLVLEANEEIGGDTFTQELTVPGFRHDACSSAHVLIQTSPTLRNNELELGRYGLEYLLPDPVFVFPFPDGECLIMWRDPERTAREMARFSEADARAYRELLRDWDGIKAFFNRERYSPPRPPSQSAAELESLPGGLEWMRTRSKSALQVVSERFREPHVRTFLLWIAYLTTQPPDLPGGGLLPFALTSGRQAFSWATPKGGSVALPRALARIVTETGGRIRTGQPVARILSSGGRATGVETEAGARYLARRGVVSNLHLAHLEGAVGRENLAPDLRQAIREWQPGTTLFAAHYALSEPPLWRTHHGPMPAVAMGTATSEENLLDHLHDFRRGVPRTRDPVLLCITSSVVDPTRAPGDAHTFKILGFLPYELREGPRQWDAIKEEVAGQLFGFLEGLTTNLDPGKVLGSHVESPLDLERRNRHNWRGSCHGGDLLSPAQSGYFRPAPGWSSYRLPLEGLYQTGACTHPGGSVSGGPGRNCARVILEDLGTGLEEIVGTPASAAGGPS